MFVVTDAVQSWKAFEIQARKSCDVFRVLSISTLFFQACNITAMTLVYSDHNSPANQDASSSKRKITAALSLGLSGSAMIWWYSCFPHEFLSQMTAVFMFVVAAAFAFLFAVDIRHRLVNTIPGTTIKTGSLAWNVCREHKRPLAFIILLLTCLVVVLSDVPRSTLHFNASVYSIMMIFQRSGVGIGLPLTITDLIDSSSEDYEQDKFVAI